MLYFWPPIVAVTIAVLVGLYYRKKLLRKYKSDVCKYNSLSPLTISINFDSGLFDCFKDQKSVKKFMFACFCPSVRWAANASATGFMDFWTALIIASLFMTFMFVLGFVGRSHIRAKSDMQKNPVGDFFSWCCCYACALMQEAKFVDSGFREIRDALQVSELEAQSPISTLFAIEDVAEQPDPPGTTYSNEPEQSDGPVISISIEETASPDIENPCEADEDPSPVKANPDGAADQPPLPIVTKPDEADRPPTPETVASNSAKPEGCGIM
jgi:Cys-rich protein (TIGR01571 family)